MNIEAERLAQQAGPNRPIPRERAGIQELLALHAKHQDDQDQEEDQEMRVGLAQHAKHQDDHQQDEQVRLDSPNTYML